ncbi:MAG TPA: hypothetical protein VKZ68_07885 [Ohtaekwangia sp.]|nr:hypothetical protein [Ohtaekwangia sp.]
MRLKTTKAFRSLLIVQSVYTLITGVWPLIHIESFIAATGPKEDIWLVKTVGAMLIPVSLALAAFVWINASRIPAILLGGLMAVVFAVIDFHYALADVISNVYMLDGVLQLIFIIGWIWIARLELLDHRKSLERKTTVFIR